jgi:hypothetical protein
MAGGIIAVGVIVAVIGLTASVTLWALSRATGANEPQRRYSRGIWLALVGAMILGSLAALAGWGMSMIGPITVAG